MVKKLFTAMAAICACALALVLPATAFAAPGDVCPVVVYDGSAKQWHGENLQEQDVIAVTRDVLPGDTLTQEFELVARNIKRGVTLGIRPDANAATLAALGDMTLEVADGYGAPIARGTLAGLADTKGAPLDLGSYTANAKIPLHITLAIPTSVGNESQGAVHEIAWIFTAQEDGDTVSAGSDDLLAQTGDDPLSVYGPMVLGALGVLLILAAVVQRKRR